MATLSPGQLDRGGHGLGRASATAGAIIVWSLIFALVVAALQYGRSRLASDNASKAFRIIPAGFNANLLLHSSGEMMLGRQEVVICRISKNPNVSLYKDLEPSANDQVEPINATDFMMVGILGDDGFSVTPGNEQEQFVADDQFTQWTALVTPQKSGEHNLILRVGVEYQPSSGGRAPRYYPDQLDKISVSEGISYWFASTWLSYRTTIVSFMLGFVSACAVQLIFRKK